MHDESSNPDQFALSSSNSFGNSYPSGITSAAAAAAAVANSSLPGYSLDALEMMKRTSSQAYDGQPGVGGLASMTGGADNGSKKARYGANDNGGLQQQASFGAGVLGGYDNLGQSSANTQAGFGGLGGFSGQQQSQQSYNTNSGVGLGSMQQNSNGASANRSFSGGSLGGMLGQQQGISASGSLGSFPAQSSPFMGAGSPYGPSLSLPNAAAMFAGQNSTQGYGGPMGGNPSPPFSMGGNAGAGGANVYGGFPGGFSPSNMGGFMPSTGLLAGGPQQLGQGNQTGRTVYVGNLPADASVDELLNLVKFGPIENVRLLPEKNCAFISFLDGSTAAAFHADACVKKISLHNQELKIGWGKPSACPTPVMMAVQQSQATRNVYLGQLEDHVTEQSLRDDLARFGPIDQVKIVRDKNIGFIHFLSIQTAMKVVATLPTEPAWAGKRVNYGKDRCAYVPKSQQQNQAHNNQAAAMGMAAAASLGYPTGYTPGQSQFNNFGALGQQNGFGGVDDQGRSPASSVFGPAAAMMGANAAALQQMGNRTVYLGNIHPETTTEEICNHIRGGILQNVRYIPEKHIAFVTFVDPNTALAFFHLASYSGIMIHNRRLKIGWGKHSGPLSPAIAMAVQSGGSRNVYVGNIDDPDNLTEEKLRQDFGEYGEIELVNSLREKNCAFVNFTNISNAIKAIEAMKNHADYQKVKIAFGKDRCGNPPRSVHQAVHANQGGNGGARESSGSHSPNAAGDDNSVMAGVDGLQVDATGLPAIAAGAEGASDEPMM